jgi:hypothetical protein
MSGASIMRADLVHSPDQGRRVLSGGSVAIVRRPERTISRAGTMLIGIAGKQQPGGPTATVGRALLTVDTVSGEWSTR